MSKSKSKTTVDYYGRPWTESEEVLLYCMRDDGIPYKVIASEICRSVDSCRTKFKSTLWTTKSYYDPVRGRIKERCKKAYLERIAQVNDRRLHVKQLSADIISDRIAQCVDSLPPVSLNTYKKNISKKKTNSPEDVGLIISDSHIGQEITLEETGGLAEYNLNIFLKRVNNIKLATADIVELHSTLYELPCLHIFCLGDIVAGMNDVGAWSHTNINMPIYEQFVEGVNALADMIHYWLGLFKEIKFYGVYGNHGRVSEKGSEKEYVNWDFLAYQFLMARFGKEPRVVFNVPKAWWIFTKIRNHKFLILHGDDIKAKSFPVNGLRTSEMNMIGLLKDIPDYTLAGHYHNSGELSTNHGKVIMNGAFIGGDLYSLKALQKSSKPEQKIFGIHDKRGITWTYNLDLSIDRK